MLPSEPLKMALLNDKRTLPCPLVLLGSPGRIRTYNQLVNSELRYHCATGECRDEYSGFEAIVKCIAHNRCTN